LKYIITNSQNGGCKQNREYIENYSYLMHHCKVSGQIIHTFMRRPFLIFHIVANQKLAYINPVFILYVEWEKVITIF